MSTQGMSARGMSAKDAAVALVSLDPDHPGFRDPVYRARRHDIARLALATGPRDPIPRVNYTDAEHEVWRTVWDKLRPEHARHACRAYNEACAALALDHEHIPQLADINLHLSPRTGYTMRPVAGLVASRNFLGSLADGIFLSTQYIRHPSRPLYTPEPDIVHELIGHAATLYRPEFADLNRLFGRAAARAPESALVLLERLYWYTVEFGVIDEDGEPKAYGAGLFSSFGELGGFARSAFLSDFDADEAAARPYDPTDYQSVLFVIPSFASLTASLHRWFDSHIL